MLDDIDSLKSGIANPYIGVPQTTNDAETISIDFDNLDSLHEILDEHFGQKEEESKLPKELVEPCNWEESAKRKRDEIFRGMF